MRIAALIKRIIIQMLRDRRTLALLLVAPLFILTLMNLIFNSNETVPKLGVVNVDSQIIKYIKDEKVQIFKYKTADKQTVLSNDLDGLLKIVDDKPYLLLENSDTTTAKLLQGKVTKGYANSFKADMEDVKSKINDLKKESEDLSKKQKKNIANFKAKITEQKANVEKMQAEATKQKALAAKQQAQLKKQMKVFATQMQQMFAQLKQKAAQVQQATGVNILDGVKFLTLPDFEKLMSMPSSSTASSGSLDFNKILTAIDKLSSTDAPNISDTVDVNTMKLPDIKTSYIYGNEDTPLFDTLGPVLVGFFVFFFVFLIAGIGLLRERTTGTLGRLLSTPINRFEVISGYMAGYGIFAVIQTVIMVLFAVNILGLDVVGSIFDVIIINLILAMVALSLGILLSTFASSEFQMMQFIPLAIIPQVFFSGIFSMDNMTPWLQGLGKIMPMYYGADALRAIMYKGLPLSSVSGDLAVLGIFFVVFFGLNLVVLKRR